MIRAAGVAAGEIAPPPAAAEKGSGAFQDVPAGLVREQCWQFKPAVSAACAVPPGSDDTPCAPAPAPVATTPSTTPWWAGRSTLWPGWSGVLLARFISAGIAAALLASAFVVAVNWSRRRLMIAGLLVAVTPMAAQMASAVNPNGVEIAAGVAFFAATIPLFLDRRPKPHHGLLILAGISGLLLAMLRQTGPLWLAAAFVAFAFPWRQSNVGRLVREKAVWWWVGGIAVAALTAVGWGVVMKSSDLGKYGGHVYTYGQAAFAEADRWRGYLDQMVGVTSWLDTRMPAPIYLTWQFVAATLLIGAFVFGRLVDRGRLLVLIVAGTVVPSVMQVALVKQTGFVTQGRYMLPMLAGVMLFAAYVWEERGLDAARSRTLVRLSVILLLPIQLFALILTMVRWQDGLPKIPDLPHLQPVRRRLAPATRLDHAPAGERARSDPARRPRLAGSMRPLSKPGEPTPAIAEQTPAADLR